VKEQELLDLVWSLTEDDCDNLPYLDTRNECERNHFRGELSRILSAKLPAPTQHQWFTWRGLHDYITALVR